MRKIAYALMICLISTAAMADDRGNAVEAKALLQKAVEHYRAVGRDQAMKDFSVKGGPFTDRDLYVACVGPDNKNIAHGANPMFIGKDIAPITDVDGRHFALEQAEVARTKGEGTVEYNWPNPVTKKIETKVSFIQRIDNDFCFVGYYK